MLAGEMASLPSPAPGLLVNILNMSDPITRGMKQILGQPKEQ